MPGSSSVELRPVVFDYRAPQAFLKDLLAYHKAKQPTVSLRQRIKLANVRCSISLVSQVLASKRSLTRNQLPNLARILSLSPREFDYLDVLLRKDLDQHLPASPAQTAEPKAKVTAKNNLFKFWLNPYVKDVASLEGFKPVVSVVHRMLKGLAGPAQIERSLRDLLQEGFLKTQLDGRVVVDEKIVFSTNEIPVAKIQEFHKRALRIAESGLSRYGIDERKASTVLITVDQAGKKKLRALLDDFQHQLAEFMTQNPDGKTELVQVCLNLTPIGESHET